MPLTSAPPESPLERKSRLAREEADHAFELDQKKGHLWMGLILFGVMLIVAAKILSVNEVLGGISRITFPMNAVAVPHESMLHAIEILATRVAPLVRKALPASGEGGLTNRT